MFDESDASGEAAITPLSEACRVPEAKAPAFLASTEAGHVRASLFAAAGSGTGWLRSAGKRTSPCAHEFVGAIMARKAHLTGIDGTGGGEMLIDRHDAALKAAVLCELRLDARVNETEIGVAVTKGTVTLTGSVDCDWEKAAAEEAAQRATGVLDVANDIVVKVPFALGRDDTDLARAVRVALEREADVPAERIHTGVYDAVVTLSGVVETTEASHLAERAAHRVAGVRRVANKLVVGGRRIDLPALRRSIDEALERRAHREAGHIELSAHDGVVVLEGRVNSFADKSVVLELVRHAPAVRGIDDRLRIEP